MTLIEAAKQALEALYMANTREWPENKIGAAINALSAAIEQAEKQEPVAWMDASETALSWENYLDGMKPLYTNPPAQRQWVGLTEKDFSAINQSCLTKLQAATSAESILKEKNHER